MVKVSDLNLGKTTQNKGMVGRMHGLPRKWFFPIDGKLGKTFGAPHLDF
jgi:hypothetical protein